MQTEYSFIWRRPDKVRKGSEKVKRFHKERLWKAVFYSLFILRYFKGELNRQ